MTPEPPDGAAAPSPLDDERYPLELSRAAMRAMIDGARDRLIAHVASLPEQRLADVEGGEALARSLREGPPHAATPFDELLDGLFDELVPKTFNTASPGYLAYIPGGGLVHSAIADLLAGATNRYVGVWQAAPGLAQLEANVVDWFSRIVGYPRQARGFLTTGGSLANLTAVITARRDRLPEDFLRGTLYTSSQTHHSVAKAATLAGFPAASVRMVPADGEYRVRLDALTEMIAADRARGMQPFLLVGSAGTTNTGAVDDLEALADLAAREQLWLHHDAAYGGFFCLTERGKQRLGGIQRADSITLDPHKGLFLPYGTGCLLVRDGETLRRAHAIDADYMPKLQKDGDLVDFCQISPELSRDFRGLRVWLPLKMHGLGAFAAALDEKLDLTEWAHRELQTIPGLEIVAAPQLTVVAFRLASPGVEVEEANRRNRAFLDAVNARQRVFLTPTTLDGRFVLRICVLSFRTHLDRMRAGLEDVRQAAAEVLAAA